LADTRKRILVRLLSMWLADLVLALLFRLVGAQDDLLGLLVLAMESQLTLAAMWLVLGTGHAPWRLLGTAVAAIGVPGSVALAADPQLGLPLVVLGAAHCLLVTLALLMLRAGGVRVRIVPKEVRRAMRRRYRSAPAHDAHHVAEQQELEETAPRPFQFSLFYLLALTTAVALILSLLKSVAALFDWQSLAFDETLGVGLIILYWELCQIPVVCLTLGLVLGNPRHFWGWGALFAMIIASGLLAALFWESEAGLVMEVLVFLNVALHLLHMLVLRGADVRIVMVPPARRRASHSIVVSVQAPDHDHESGQ